MRKAMRNLVVIGVLAVGFGAAAADSVQMKETHQGLSALATIRPDAAKDLAIRQVPGTLKSNTLDGKDGELVYIVKIATSGGESTVRIDARTGDVLSVASPNAPVREFKRASKPVNSGEKAVGRKR